MWWENHIVLIQNIDTWHAQSRNIRNTFSSVFRSFPIIFLGFPIMFKSHCQYIFHRLVVSERFPAHGWSPIDHTRPTRLSCSCHAKHLVLEQVVRHVFVGDASRKGAKGQKKKNTRSQDLRKDRVLNVLTHKNENHSGHTWILMYVYRRHWNHQLGQVFFRPGQVLWMAKSCGWICYNRRPMEAILLKTCSIFCSPQQNLIFCWLAGDFPL